MTSSRPVSQPLVSLTNIRWNKRLNFGPLKQERLNFKVSDLVFVPAGLTTLSGKTPVSKTTFNLTNLSAYNFWKVGVTVVLYTGSQVVGVNYISLEKIMSAQTVPVEVNWFQALGQVTKSEVYVDVNILDDSIYMNFAPGERNDYRQMPR